MNKHYSVSIALASYNGELFIKEQIISLLNQTICPNEIIIVDDGSVDGTCEILDSLKQEYPVISYYKNSFNLGVIESFKIAISKCSSEYVAISDQDDIWEMDKLEKSMDALFLIEQPNRPAIVFSDLKVIDSKNVILFNSFWELQGFKTHYWNFKDTLIGNVATGCTIVMNNKMKKEVEKMPNSIIMHDHWIALVAFGVGDFGIIDQPLVRYRLHSNSVTLKTKLTYLIRFRLFLSVIFEPNGNYFNSNIKQAELFLQLYQTYLDKRKLRDLRFIISLKKKSLLIRKLNIGFYKYFYRTLRVNFRY